MRAEREKHMPTNTTPKAPTKKENFTAIKAFLESNGADKALVDAVNHELELLAKRAEKPSKTAEQVDADKALVDAITAVLADGSKKTVSDMQKASAELLAVSCSKITSLLTRVIVPSGAVKREEIKRKAYYSKV